MKIEKLSDNQIRCTLNSSDLASRQLKISELAYGSDKAKALFRDMMQQASYELGFEAEDIPLMIEAIPISADCIVLIVTKVDDPEELDTRFSRFSPANNDDDIDNLDYQDSLESIDSGNNYELPTANAELPDGYNDNCSSDNTSIQDPVSSLDETTSNLFNKLDELFNPSNIKNKANEVTDDSLDSDNFVSLHDSLTNGHKSNKSSNKSMDSANHNNSDSKKTIRIFSFDSFDTFEEASHAVSSIYSDINSLYKDNVSGIYYLTLEKNMCTAVNFNKTCNILSEYGTKDNIPSAGACYFKEHLDCIINRRAIQVAARY